jgi:hypothetical protein
MNSKLNKFLTSLSMWMHRVGSKLMDPIRYRCSDCFAELPEMTTCSTKQLL